MRPIWIDWYMNALQIYKRCCLILYYLNWIIAHIYKKRIKRTHLISRERAPVHSIVLSACSCHFQQHQNHITYFFVWSERKIYWKFRKMACRKLILSQIKAPTRQLRGISTGLWTSAKESDLQTETHTGQVIRQSANQSCYANLLKASVLWKQVCCVLGVRSRRLP